MLPEDAVLSEEDAGAAAEPDAARAPGRSWGEGTSGSRAGTRAATRTIASPLVRVSTTSPFRRPVSHPEGIAVLGAEPRGAERAACGSTTADGPQSTDSLLLRLWSKRRAARPGAP